MKIKVFCLVSLLLTACAADSAKNELGAKPFVQAVEKHSVMLAFMPSATPVLTTEVTLRKESILNRAFLYGSSLQFSSIFEGESLPTPTSLMAIALGQIPAEFRVIDDKLRLVTDARLNFESDVNAPSRLIQEFPILRQDAETITIRADKASPILDTFLFGAKSKIEKRASWIRDLEFAAGDDLMMIESSVELVDGSLAEFMETITPRDRLVSADTKPIYADPALNPLAERFRFLSGEEIYLDHPEAGRVKTKVANRFVPKAGEAIRWYVTKNIPDANLIDVKNGVEAWNRYSRAAGKPDMIRFEGRLPEGVKVGDPRYNLIVWDTVQAAGAAYESQSADPFTGVQSHSLIYLPLAWINIGKAYWENALHAEQDSETKMANVSRLLKSRRFQGRALPVNCVDGAHLHVNAASRLSPEEFARELLKSVVFHEVGHALGLNHNFKGSLSFKGEDPSSMFSDSIMDYNEYNEELKAFSSLETADGPLLEYDRQIISVLYNEGKDVRESDPVLAACNDEEADSLDDGVDPLCARYDIGQDPTLQAQRALNLLAQKDLRSGRVVSLPMALGGLLEGLPAADSILTVADAANAVNAVTKSAVGVSNMYISGTANSLGYQGSQAIRSLHVFRPDILPARYDENGMRERSLSLLEDVITRGSLPPATQQALAELRSGLNAWLLLTPAFANLPEPGRSAQLSQLNGTVEQTLVSAQATMLSRLRTRFIGGLNYSDTAPMSFHARAGVPIDVEALVISLLENSVAGKAGSADRPMAERLAAAKTLSTYGKISTAQDARLRLLSQVTTEIRLSSDARKREELRKLEAALQW